MQQKDFNETSYQAHENWYKSMENVPIRIENKNSIAFWRHNRMFELLRPLVESGDKWLTVGDGLGTDAYWLRENGADVMASDIADDFLKESLRRGHIDKFQKENAEALSFAADSFRYALCKEAYHHFPRPYLALYEMLRVASDAVALIEPIDIGVQMPYIVWLKNILDRFNVRLIDRVWKNRYSFEPIGNYVYKISEREIEKVAMGMNLKAVAFKGLNDYYNEKLDFNQSTESPLFRTVQRKIARRDALTRIGLIPPHLAAALIFKKLPSPELSAKLIAAGYKYIELKPNPYLR